MSRFIVDLGNISLSEAQKNAIASAIQQAVLAQLASHAAPAAGLTTASSLQATYSLIPIKWLGQLWRPNFSELQQAENQIEAFANQQTP
jgi:hypothetical protein